MGAEVGTYLELKKDGTLREVWIEGRDLRADLLQPVSKDGTRQFKVHVRLPAELVAMEKGVHSLIDGLDPGPVHQTTKQ